MFSDPLSITYNSSAKSLTRLTLGGTNQGKAYPSRFRTSNGEFEVNILETSAGEMTRVEITLTRSEVDTDPSNGFQSAPNSFGLVYEFNRSQYNTATDVPLLRTALLSFVDSTLQGRLIGGEK